MFDVVGRIKELTDAKGWSFYELAKQAGISANAVYEWDKGAAPALSSILSICEVMGISEEQFFCGDDGYQLTEEEKFILNEWFTLSDLEKKAVLSMIDTFKILKNDK